MESIYKVRKSLESNKNDIGRIELVIVSGGALNSKYTFTSASEFDNFISRDDSDSLYKGQFEVIIDRECDPFTLKTRKNYRIKAYPVKKTDRYIPYYQFHNGNVCNINGDAFAPEIKNVIFNPPATIIIWADGTKTVVKCHGEDEFDPEKGLAMAISKKMLSNKYEYYDVFKKWLKKWEKQEEEATSFDKLKEALDKISIPQLLATHPTRTIEFRRLDETVNKIEQLTGKNIDDLIDIFAKGGTITLPSKPCENLADITLEGSTCCKDCEKFVPAKDLDPDNYPYISEYDGMCTNENQPHYTDAFETCADAMKKAGENIETISKSVKRKKIAPDDVDRIDKMINSKINE